MSQCYHCGDDLPKQVILFEEKSFCCIGCKSVYELLHNHQLESFYQFEGQAGIKPNSNSIEKYKFLEIEDISKKFIDYQDEKQIKTTLFLPSIHCSSCVYLLENLHKIHPGVYGVLVNFTKREAVINFDPNKITFAELAHLLDKIGYTPNFGNRQQIQKKLNKKFLYKLGVAGFGFGSIMLWSFPEYLGIESNHPEFRNFTAKLSFLFSLPVLFFSASEYYISAFKAIRAKQINLDVPITIGIIALYAQSTYSIFSGQGPGYMDSFASFIFFLLIGKWFQNKTYQSLSFERDYTSYFPVAVTRIKEGVKDIVEIEKINIGEDIEVRNEEVIPCDSILKSPEAQIDYSFVTGESDLITKKSGDFIYAGGKLIGQKVILSCVKEANRSHLTQLWNQTVKSNEETNASKYQVKLSYYFLWIILVIAILASVFWYFKEPSQITNIIVSILIVACPCALALSAPFTYGNLTRVMGRKGLYLKNALVIEQLNEITDIVFDKTGTLTTTEDHEIVFNDLKEDAYLNAFYSLANSSTHPISKAIAKALYAKYPVKEIDLEQFSEIKGKGISAFWNGKQLKIGSATFCEMENEPKTTSYFTINQEKWGSCYLSSTFREGIESLNTDLEQYDLHVISGDQAQDKGKIEKLLPTIKNIHFHLNPQEKSQYIQNLQSQGKKVLMIGDGLNDAGALTVAEVGIAVSENIFRFTPASDAIIEAKVLKDLPKLLKINLFSKTILRTSLLFSLCYNTIGLSIAIAGYMTPLVAAILMPISSITVVFITTFLAISKK